MAKNVKAPEPTGYTLIEMRAENFKKLKAVRIKPDGSLFKIVGQNEQGKSSVLDAFVAAVAGKDAFPAEPVRKGKKNAEIFLDFGGFKLTRKIWNKEDGGIAHSVVIEMADGAKPKHSQQFLDALRGSPIADDPIEFARLKPKERFDLMKTLVRDFDFEANARERAELVNERLLVGREYERAKGVVESIELPANAPALAVDVTEMATELREAYDFNEKLNARARNRADVADKLNTLRDEIDILTAQIKDKVAEVAAIEDKLSKAEPLPAFRDVAAIEARMASAKEVNEVAVRVKERADKVRERDEKEQRYDDLTQQIAAVDKAKEDAIAGAEIPVEGLSLGEGDILLDGLPFDQASTARKIRTATALLMALKPEMRVLLVREGSLLDNESRAALAADAAAHGFVVLMEVVGTAAIGGHGVVIEDGEIVA